MTNDGDQSSEGNLLLGRPAVLSLTQQGMRVPGVLGPFLRNDLAMLLVLTELASGEHATVDALCDRVAAQSAAPPLRVRRLVSTLDEAGLVVTGSGGPDGAALASDQRLDPMTVDALGESVDDDDVIGAAVPLLLAIRPDGFEAIDHDGGRIVLLSPVELLAISELCTPATLAEATAASTSRHDPGLDANQIRALFERSLATGIVRRHADSGHDPTVNLGASEQTHVEQLRTELAAVIAERRAPRAEGDDRIQVIPVTYKDIRPPLALGLIFAYAIEYEGGRLLERYDLRKEWATTDAVLESASDAPSVFLFSNYLWSHDECLAASARVKELNPGCITIHGGPNTPKYPADVEAHLAEYPHVDITVRGEGEITTAEALDVLADVIGGPDPDLSVLADVAGLSYRDGDTVVHTADRPRMTDVNVVPSPYLTGLFDAYEEVGETHSAVIESNRGCPYGCTFCDWGSATASRIRKFDLDRVFDELEWCAKHGFPSINMSDSNFGIFDRDVAIADKVVELNTRYGHPNAFGVSMAKNTAKHLKPIISSLIDAGILTQGMLSLQTMDEDTLKVIKRSNIKLEKYEELAAEFRRAGLPMIVDIMMGLPGQTLTSFRNDLQECVDREVAVNSPTTQLLVNSPMNAPEYREEHGIVAKPSQLVMSTATFTREDYAKMSRLRRLFYLFDNFGVLRLTSRWVRQETGCAELDLYTGMMRDADDEPQRWPVLHLTTKRLVRIMAPPVSWRLFHDELRRYLVEVVGAPDDTSLDAILTAHRALLPARDRTFPVTVELEHDVVAWNQAMLDAKDAGHHHDWTGHTPHLRDLGPATLEVNDLAGVADWGFGFAVDSYGMGLSWELSSPLNRPTNLRRSTAEDLNLDRHRSRARTPF